MIKKYEQIIADLKTKNLSPIYVLTGDEPFYIDALAEQFDSLVLDETEKDFNQQVLYGRDITIDDILSNAKQYPMMSDYRLILVREAQDIEKEDWTKFDSYFNNPVPTSIIVICYKYKSINKAFLKKVEKAGVVFESKKLYDNNIPQWTINYAKSIGLKIDSYGSQLIADYLGNNLEKIANELSKLKLNLKENEEITINLIEEYIGISKDFNVFELQKALTSRDILTANRIINYFEANPKENPIQRIMPALLSYFTKIIIAAQVKDKTPDNISKAIGVNKFYLNEYLTAINSFSLDKLFNIISLIREYDLKSKGLDVAPNLSNGDLLKELVYKITH
ncbi:MAG: DNA polymerase III subunit delta [Bacteroidales bacterium]|nr:DNA polymerase III subunit delta [Bacteroidales bacterium]